MSEDDFQKKRIYTRRSARVGIRNPIYNDLNEELSNLQEEQKKDWGERLFTALRAKSEVEEESPAVK